jgi:phosphonate transport system permease protein
VTAPSAAPSPPYPPAGAAGELAPRGGGVRPATPPEELRARLLQPWPRMGGGFLLTLVVLGAAYVWGLNGTQARPDELARGVPNILDFVRRLAPPVWETQAVPLALPPITLPGGTTLPAAGDPATKLPVPVIHFAILETVQMALIGTTLAVVLALPFGLLAARNTSPHRLVYQGTRLLLNANRAVPDIIFALIFVAAVGLGPFSGVLALAVGAIGFMGKLYAEAIESIDPQQVQAVRATGANPLQTFVFGAVPQALPLVAAYSLLLFETNVRSATILGIVGAGGVGFVLSKYMALFQYQRLLGALILIILAVTLIDRASDALRRRII